MHPERSELSSIFYMANLISVSKCLELRGWPPIYAGVRIQLLQRGLDFAFREPGSLSYHHPAYLSSALLPGGSYLPNRLCLWIGRAERQPAATSKLGCLLLGGDGE